MLPVWIRLALIAFDKVLITADAVKQIEEMLA